MAGEMAERSGGLVSTGTGTGGASVTLGGSGAGVSSTVECLPVVHGGISRNSSNVKTRGLQHFQPGKLASRCKAGVAITVIVVDKPRPHCRTTDTDGV